MKFRPLHVGKVSATFELDNNDIYYSPEPFDVVINGAVVLSSVKTNVFTVYDLKPNTDYTVKIGSDALLIKTEPCTFILEMKDFKNPFALDDTRSFQAAIAALPKGGLLVVNEGEYHISSIFLKSDMTLYLKKGATLLGSTDKSQYGFMPGEKPYPNNPDKKLQITAWEGNPLHGLTSIVSAYQAENIEIVGEGTIDGQAHLSDFWKDVKTLTYARPRLLFFNNCRNVVLEGITVQNSPSWTIHPYFTDNIGIYNLKINNPKDSPNTDGIDPESCDGVKIIGIHFSVGDDCIALKSGKIYIGSTYKKPTRNVEIRNCLMHEGHGAVVLGSEAGAGVRDIDVRRCIFERTDRGLRIKSRRGRGKDSYIDGIVFKDIIMDGVLTPLVINMFYFCDPDGHSDVVRNKNKLPVDASTPYLGKFTFENIVATEAEYALGWFYGLPEQPIAEINIKNSSFTMKEKAGYGFPAMMDDIEKQSLRGFVFENVNHVNIENVVTSGYVGEEVTAHNVASVKRT